MNPLKKYTLFLFTTLSFLCIPRLYAKEIFVSSSNPITGDGSLINPYKTIQEAVDVAVSGDIVTIRAGVYREEVRMKADGITYRSYPGEKVVINGTEQLKEWIQVAGSTVYQTNMDFDAPRSESPNYPTNQLFVDGKMIELARWPNQSSSNISIPSNAYFDDVSIAGTVGPLRNYAIIKDMAFDEPDGRWVGATIWINLSVDNLDGQGWTGTVLATDRAAHTITYNFREPPRLNNQPWAVRPGTEYYLFNPTKAGVEATGGVGAIVEPGEWLKLENTVYVNLPNMGIPNSTDLGPNKVEAKKREFAFRSSSDTLNRSNYTIKDIDLFANTITTNIRFLQGYKTVIEDANFVTLQGIKAKYLSHFTETGAFGGENTYGRSGIVLSGRNCVIRDCEIEFSAAQGISILGEGNKAFNNVITSVNYMISNAGALCTGSICTDCEVGYNTISNTSHIGINFSGLVNSNGNNKGLARIHHNKVYDFLLRSNDSGGINDVSTFGNWARIDHNVLYKTFNTTRSEQDVYGLYFDYNQGSYLVDHNLVYGMKQAMLINRAKDMSIYNNTLLTNLYTEQAIVDATGGDGTSDTIRNNILSGAANTPCCRFNNLRRAVTDHNIVNAFGRENQIFVNPGAGNFELKATTTEAIDKGVNFYQFNDPIVGSAVDLGAFEYGLPAWVAGPTNLLPPAIIPNSGEFIDEAQISFKSESIEPNTTIRYTLNGSDPTINSPLFTQSVTITDTTWVKARIFVNDLPVGDIASSRILVTKIANIPPITVTISKESGSFPVRTFVSIFSPNPEVREIRYTLDGTEPTKDSPVSNGGVIFITSTTTIKAIAFGKYIASPIKTSVITITGPLLAISPNGGNITAPTRVTLTATPSFETKIYYTLDGSTPNATSAEYTSPITISSTTTLKAIAINGTFISEVKTAEFIAAVNNVVISPNGKTTKDEDITNITLTTQDPNAIIYYTLDGSTPNQASTLYNGQPLSLNTSKTLKSVAYVNGVGGTVSSAIFTITGPDVAITPAGNKFTNVFKVTLNSVAGASIYYTTDGTTPTSASNLYTVPFVVTEPSTTVKAIAIRNGNVGEEKTESYTLVPTEAKVIIFPNPISGGQFSIKFNSPKKGHVIRVSIYDVLGRLILTKSITMIDSILQEEAFDVPYLKTGTYIIKMQTVSAHLTDLLDEEVKLVVK